MFYEDPYLEFVNQEALKLGKYFILDSGEGRGFVDTVRNWDVEDLSGWLIEPSEHHRFINSKKAGIVDVDFPDCYVFAKWLKDTTGNLRITFKRY